MYYHHITAYNYIWIVYNIHIHFYLFVYSDSLATPPTISSSTQQQQQGSSVSWCNYITMYIIVVPFDGAKLAHKVTSVMPA